MVNMSEAISLLTEWERKHGLFALKRLKSFANILKSYFISNSMATDTFDSCETSMLLISIPCNTHGI